MFYFLFRQKKKRTHTTNNKQIMDVQEEWERVRGKRLADFYITSAEYQRARARFIDAGLLKTRSGSVRNRDDRLRVIRQHRKTWRQKNPDKQRAHTMKYWQKKLAQANIATEK